METKTTNKEIVKILENPISVIETEEHLISAKEFNKKIKDRYNLIEEERKSITQPILDSKKAIDEKYKVLTAPLLQAEKEIKALIVDYLNRKELEIKKEAGKDVAKLAIKDENVSFRIDYDIEVTDITKVSKDYLLVDESKIKQKIREGQKTFSGIKLIEKKIIINR